MVRNEYVEIDNVRIPTPVPEPAMRTVDADDGWPVFPANPGRIESAERKSASETILHGPDTRLSFLP